jgi:hypothetical protein
MNIPSLIEALYHALQSLGRLAWDNSQKALNLITLALAFAVLWGGWLSFGQQQVVLFVGPPGSSTARVGQDLVERFAATRNANGVNYRVSLEPTAGTFSIRERMALESTRIPLGFVEDGQVTGPQSANLRALLPMDWDYLFVLCSRKWLREQPISKPQTLFDILSQLKSLRSGRIFIGPEKSGTAEMARTVLAKFEEVREEQYSKGIGDWKEMRMALKSDEIDLAFYSGPIGSETLTELASDGTCALLGLGPITDAIEQETGAKYLASQLPPHLAVAQSFPSPKVDLQKSSSGVSQGSQAEVPTADKQPIPFCQPDLHTIASRRVLACPASLTAGDAYQLGSTAVELLRNKGYEINLAADDLPYGSQRKAGISLRMQPHAALVAMRQGTAPFVWRQISTWPSWLQSIAALLLGLLGLDLLRTLSGRLDAAMEDNRDTSLREESMATTVPNLPVNAEPRPAYQRLLQQLDQAEQEVDDKPHVDLAAELPQWNERLKFLRRSIRSAELEESQRELLLKRVATLKYEVNLSAYCLSKPSTKKSRHGRTDPPTPNLEPAPPVE